MLRAEVALGLAQIGAAAGDPAETEALLAEFTALVPDPAPAMVVDFEAARILCSAITGAWHGQRQYGLGPA